MTDALLMSRVASIFSATPKLAFRLAILSLMVIILILNGGSAALASPEMGC